MKYDFIKARLAELGKTQTEFADAIGITQSKLNVTLNHPELREFQTNEIIKAAVFLGYSPESFMSYVADGQHVPTLDDKNSFTPFITISPETMVDILYTIHEFLLENHLTMSQDQEKQLLKSFYEKGCRDPEVIKQTLSALRAVGSDIFTKGK